ncbi:hypothetical protein BYT27DRAFT_7258789 [Phlegmacium glaucopus]|nr:hypothetical protein BYT27DRAFT_7258789 [Phlegmacium glaucopus]
MQGVFGDPDASEVAAGHSMDLDHLLDAVDAKMVHFPSYACTSFIAGQVMNAYLMNQLELTPIPAPSGFSISGSEPPSVIRSAPSFTSEIGQCSDDNISIEGAPIPLLPSGFHLDDLQETFSLASSGVRLSGSASKSSDSEEEAGDVGDSTIDSLGPCTPPPLPYALIPPGEWNAASKDLPGFVPAGLLHFTEENESASFINFTGSLFEDVDFNDRPA